MKMSSVSSLCPAFISRLWVKPKDNRIQVVAFEALANVVAAGAGVVGLCWGVGKAIVMVPVMSVVWVAKGIKKGCVTALIMTAFTIAFLARQIGLGVIGDKVFSLVAGKHKIEDLKFPFDVACDAWKFFNQSQKWLKQFTPHLTVNVDVKVGGK